jgi:hypothetical protein
MKKFLSIIKESSNPYTPAQESVITSFEEGSVGGDANAFLLAADTIQDEVMAQVNKIKINADEASLRDMMDKFNAFMTAYHNVGKGILQPDMFNDSMGESAEEQVDEAGQYVKRGSSSAYDRDYASSISGMGGGSGPKGYDSDGNPQGGGYDEYPNEPRRSYQAPQDRPVMTGMFFYNVQPGQEELAASLGVKKTKSGKWAKTKYTTSGNSFNHQKGRADTEFGTGKWWAPKTESIQPVAEMDKSQTPPGRDGSNSDSDAGKKEYTAKIAKPSDVVKKATTELDKEMKKSHAKEGLSFKDYVNLAEAKKGLE